MNRMRIEFILALILVPLLALPFLAHLAANDNHLNYANHNYGKNLLNTLEPNSIFMTEGGDNQVFTSAYNQMAEFQRPDVRIYDQKGNVFYRIYGDFRYMSMNEVDIKRDIVDFEIFSRGRPVYLTWKRHPDVSVCGDHFLKRYGILFKVVPLEYRFLEDLGADMEMDLGQALSFFRQYYAAKPILSKMEKNLAELQRWYGAFLDRGKIKETQNRNGAFFINEEEERRMKKAWRDYEAFLKAALGRTIDQTFMMEKLRKLEREGYLVLAGNTVRFVKDIPQPISGDYWKQYRLDFMKVPTAVHWDYLTREILANYFFNQLQDVMEQIAYYGRREAYFRRTGNAAALKENADRLADLNRIQESCFVNAAKYGHDNGAIHNNLAIIFINRKEWQRARDAFRNAVKVDPYLFMSTVYYMNLNLRLASETMDVTTEAAAVKEARELCAQAVRLIRGLGESSVPDWSLQPIGGVDQARAHFNRGDDVYVREMAGGKVETRRIEVGEIMQHSQFFIRVPGYTLNQDYQRLKRFEQEVLLPREQVSFQSIVDARKQRDANKNDMNAHLNYFSQLVRRKEMGLAVNAFHEMPEEKWKKYEVFYNYAFFLENLGQIDDAIDAYRDFLRRDPDFFVAAFRLGLLLQQRSDTDREEALALFRKVLAVDPELVKKKYPLFSSSVPAFRQAAWGQGIAVAQQLENNPALITIYEQGEADWKARLAGQDQAWYYGQALEAANRHRDAAAVYEKAVSVNALAWRQAYRLGVLREERFNELPGAHDMYRKLINMQQHVPRYLPQEQQQTYYMMRNDAYRRLQQTGGLSGQ